MEEFRLVEDEDEVDEDEDEDDDDDDDDDHADDDIFPYLFWVFLCGGGQAKLFVRSTCK